MGKCKEEKIDFSARVDLARQARDGAIHFLRTSKEQRCRGEFETFTVPAVRGGLLNSETLKQHDVNNGDVGKVLSGKPADIPSTTRRALANVVITNADLVLGYV